MKNLFNLFLKLFNFMFKNKQTVKTQSESELNCPTVSPIDKNCDSGTGQAEAEHKRDELTEAEKEEIAEQRRKDMINRVKQYQHFRLMRWQAKAKIIRKKRRVRNRIQKQSRKQNR